MKLINHQDKRIDPSDFGNHALRLSCQRGQLNSVQFLLTLPEVTSKKVQWEQPEFIGMIYSTNGVAIFDVCYMLTSFIAYCV